MADYGIRVVNPTTGSVQIDQDYQNLELLEIRDIVTQANPDTTYLGGQYYKSGFSHFTIELNPGGIPGATAIREIFFASTAYVSKRGLNRYALGNPIHYAVNAPPGTLVRAYIFGSPATALLAGEDYGLVVRTNAGDVAFNSNRKYLNLVHVAAAADYKVTMPSAALPAGRTYACAIASRTGRSRIKEGSPLPGGQVYEYRFREEGPMVRMNGNVLQSIDTEWMDGNIWQQWSYFGANYDADIRNPSYAVLVADVTYFQET